MQTAGQPGVKQDTIRSVRWEAKLHYAHSKTNTESKQTYLIVCLGRHSSNKKPVMVRVAQQAGNAPALILEAIDGRRIVEHLWFARRWLALKSTSIRTKSAHDECSSHKASG